MRLTSFGIVLVLVTSFMTGRASAQIPERALFQPGSYAYGMTQAAPQAAKATKTVLVEVPVATESDDVENDDDDKTDWEKNFGSKEKETTLMEVAVAVPAEDKSVPYLAYHRCPITHRIHIVPYQPGYAAAPEEFPKHQSQLNLWLSSLPCREQNRPQVKYAGYYDPDPVIVQDKPSRIQLILGYPNGAWTSCCENRWGYRMAQCPGVVPVPMGSYAEAGIKDQPYDNCVPAGPLGGVFQGPRPLDYGPMGPPPRHLRNAVADQCPCAYPAAAPQPGPYPRPLCPQKSCVDNSCGCDTCGCGTCDRQAPCPPKKNYPLKKKVASVDSEIVVE